MPGGRCEATTIPDIQIFFPIQVREPKSTASQIVLAEGQGPGGWLLHDELVGRSNCVPAWPPTVGDLLQVGECLRA